MDLYLLRHANADTTAAHDDDRPLSDKGVAQAERMARFCEAHGLVPSVILTSPLRRAHQTAKIAAEHLRVNLKIARWLASGAEAGAMLAELGKLRAQPAVMMVGHEPDFSHFVAHLLGLPRAECIRLRKGSLTLLTVHEFQPGGATLEFSLPPRLV